MSEAVKGALLVDFWDINGMAQKPIVDSLLGEDPWLLLADFGSYLEAQARVERAYLDPERWTRLSILNTARMGRFSSDRSIAEYCRDVWRVEPVPIELPPRPA